MSQVEGKSRLAPVGPASALEIHSDGRVHAHTASLGFYIAIFVALCLLTLLTVGVASVPLGRANLIVAVVIASIKASLVLLFFMHLRHDNKFNALILVVAVMFIGVFFAYTLNDTDRRGQVDPAQGVRTDPATGEAAPGGPATE